MFDDRTDAGTQLGADLKRRGVEADLVLAIPRGALPVARPVADALEADLDVVVARKLGAPGNPELALGAVASDGSVWYNDDLIDRLGVDDETLEAIRTREAAAAADKLETYRDESGGPTLEGQRVLVVDDGVATGATARACLEQARNADAAAVSLAVPVGPPQAIADLEALADAVYALREPADFRAVGQWYREFGQVSDETAMEYLS
ncbi:phosphoribosyltransferase [Natronolimnobius baerhuensis]|uniref:Phosphoribosyltransferase n=1 Tax=Natronolimnobius baerhuensis TaxID=253108 RepID=A0A202EB37_9EURY|nr:phosphoribosyltransferase family protein [Natronolimnobius baerhuensis]OVE85452.1 phosphoribosyltransferase [Natronolimnobius baerhuensis]